MNKVRFIAAPLVAVALGIASAVIIRQHTQIRRLKESQRGLAAQHQELSATNALLLSVDAARRSELIRLRQQSLEVLSLRNQLTLVRKQLTAAAENQTSKADNSNELPGYVGSEQLRYVGFGTPQDAFQSMRWAAMTGDYTNWLASLAPALQEEELTNPKSFEEFQRGLASASKIVGMQVMGAKPVGSDRMELKVRLDTDNTVTILIFPMVAIGNEWRLGDEIDSYTEAWDVSSSTK
jgi:hypothetical protein